MKRQQGFTLIELVIVLIVLGILAAMAIPRFASLQREARIAVVETFYTALRSGNHIVFAKTAANGLQNLPAACVDLEGSGTGTIATPTCTGTAVAPVNTVFGYPAATVADLTQLFEELSGRWAITTTGTVATAQLDNFTNCGVTYTQAVSDGNTPPVITRPQIVKNTAGC